MTPYIFPGLKKEPQHSFRLKIIYHLNDDKMPLKVFEVFDRLHIAHAEISSKSHTRAIVEARQIAMYLVKVNLNCTLKKIGEHFNRDHSTVIYAMETVRDLMDTSKAFKAKVDRIEKEVFTAQ